MRSNPGVIKVVAFIMLVVDTARKSVVVEGGKQLVIVLLDVVDYLLDHNLEKSSRYEPSTSRMK